VLTEKRWRIAGAREKGKALGARTTVQGQQSSRKKTGEERDKDGEKGRRSGKP